LNSFCGATLVEVSEDDARGREFICPQCGTQGHPTALSQAGEERLTTYLCPECGSAWTVRSEENKPPALKTIFHVANLERRR
jgi:predicted RNA-binding Zn-ribbon protein involved in translation (DUF1610 family)